MLLLTSDMNKTQKIGVVGAIVAAVCCFTPVLVVLLGALGLSALIGYLDFVLLPVLGLFIVLIIAGTIKGNKGAT